MNQNQWPQKVEGTTTMDQNLKDLSEQMKQLGEEIISQDNLGTMHPAFCVMQKRRCYGITEDYIDYVADGYVLVDENGEEVDACEYKEDIESGEEIEGISKVWYKNTDVVVASFFSRQAALDYIDANEHNLNEPFLFVDSQHNNPEWKKIRAYLMALAQEDLS
jgi:hypothetical protein